MRNIVETEEEEEEKNDDDDEIKRNNIHTTMKLCHPMRMKGSRIKNTIVLVNEYIFAY